MKVSILTEVWKTETGTHTGGMHHRVEASPHAS